MKSDDGLTKEEMLEGKSRPRNPLVADVFHKMAIIEKWGTGIRRMFALCRKSGVAVPGVTGGVMEAALRTAYCLITGERAMTVSRRMVAFAADHSQVWMGRAKS